MLEAAAGRVDLEPPAGIWMSGFAARIASSTGTHDPIMARAVLLDDGRARLLVVCCDLIGLVPVAAAQLRERIAAATDGAIPGASVLVACTHTHSGPASMPLRGVMGFLDGSWSTRSAERIVALAAGLVGRLQPARFTCASATVAGIGFNRQDATRPVDELLVVAGIDADDGTPIATIANYATHAVVLGPGNLLLSADYPGELARCIEAERGGTGLFLQGACGDVDPAVLRERGWGTCTFEDARGIGEQLARAALAALHRAPRSDDAAIRVERSVVDVPLEPAMGEVRLRELIAGFEADRRKAVDGPRNREAETTAEAMLDWAGEVRHALDAGRFPVSVPAEVFAAGIGGEYRILGVPFETYSDIAVAVRRRLPGLTVAFAGCANGLYGYCATGWAKQQGGYGPGESHRWFPLLLSPIAREAEALIVEEAVRLARR
jgi:neutral ceramidase